MKKLLLILLCLVSITATAQYEKSQVITLDSTYSKGKIHSKLLEWATKTFVSAKNVIHLDDREGGKIIIKCIFLTSVIRGGVVLSNGTNATIDITIKDGKYKIIVNNLIIIHPSTQTSYSYENVLEGGYPFYLRNKAKDKYIILLDNEIDLLILSSKKEIQNNQDF